MAKAIDHETKKWIRNASDELAARNGCRFDEERGRYTVEWIQTYCHLYEGDCAGQLMTLGDWQLDCTLRLFSWVRWSEDWDRWIRRFTVASIFLPKKNAKSPTLASWGTFLFCGDGEQGQKVYSVAKDGQQAKISHLHAIEMVRRSPELLAECSINKSTGQITHHPTSSIYKIVAGDNPNSQEGLNGSVMVDETHVVNRALMKILKGAGISRSEPMQIEVSTAGNNPEGYGKSQWDKGQKVIAGEFEDQGFFFEAYYAAPQDIGDAELDERIEEIGRAANPTWGRIVKPAEFRAAYDSAKLSLSDLLDFKMYRLNIWQSSENPWLNSADWEKCKRVYLADSLAGRECYGGLDLAKTRDTTALVLTFPEEDSTYKQLAFHWLPEARAQQLAHLVRYRDWAAAGFLTLTPGNVCDYAFVRRALKELFAKFQIRSLAYDDTYAAQLIQRLVEEDGLDLAIFKEFRQRIQEFAQPTSEFEKLVIAGQLHHNGNPLYTWQIGNTKVKEDVNGNMRPVKQKRGDYRTVDGPVAGIMSLAEAKLRPFPFEPGLDII